VEKGKTYQIHSFQHNVTDLKTLIDMYGRQKGIAENNGDTVAAHTAETNMNTAIRALQELTAPAEK
jgi:hypothetical protein